ncbi:MAG: hypothetical protein AB7P37_12185 [Ramlibacter sp.]
MADDFDEVDEPQPAGARLPQAGIQPGTYDAFSDRIVIEGRGGVASRHIALIRSEKNASLFRRHLLMFIVPDDRNRFILDKSMTYAYFQAKNDNESYLALKAKLVRWTAPSKAPAVPPVGTAAGIHWAFGRGPIEEARSGQAKERIREANAGGSYELLVGHLVKDYELSVRSVVEQELKDLSLDIDGLYKLFAQYSTAEEFFVSQHFEGKVAAIHEDFARARRTIEEDLMELLSRIHKIVTNVYGVRDLRRRSKTLFDGDSFKDEYLAEVFIQSCPAHSCFFSTSDGDRRQVRIYDEQNDVQLERNQKLQLEGLSNSLAHCLALDVPLARKKLQIERARGKALTIPEFLNLNKTQAS